MKPSNKEKNEQVPIVLRRMRESAELTMRQVGAMIGVSHVTISQFENGKLELPDYRIEQLVKAYGLDMGDLSKVLGRPLVASPKDDCHSIIDRLDEELLVAVSLILRQMVRTLKSEIAPSASAKVKQSESSNVAPMAQEGAVA